MALEMLGVTIKMDGNPLNEYVAQINAMVKSAGGLMAFVERPLCSDIESLRVEVLANMLSNAYLIANDIGMNLYYAVCALGTKTSFESGIALNSASLIACYAALLTALSNLPYYT